MKKIEDKIFLIVLVTIMLGGLIKPILMPKNISYLENREANQIPKFKLADILNKTYQDDFELALALSAMEIFLHQSQHSILFSFQIGT